MILGEILFPPADHRRTTLSLLSWWEARRGTFNLIVGATGLFTLLVLRLISWIPPFVDVPLDWRPVAVYGLLANVCYTFGWGIESVAQRVWGDRCPAFGPALFRQGVAFSVGLTLLPILLVSFAWVVRVVGFFVR
ncbi:MAG TPA: hypothetical protein VLN49_16260 [Gemmatimonadaceae bacterium]|nr:hypothetical protein [Gemmatimonadaceae bacterium]